MRASNQNQQVGVETADNVGRELGKIPRTIIALCSFFGIVLGIIHTFNIIFFGHVLNVVSYMFLIIALFMPVTFLKVPFSSRQKHALPWYDIALAGASFGIPFYFSFHTYEINLLAWEMGLPWPEFVAALFFLLIVLEACRRCVSLFFSCFIFAMLLYPLFAESMPWIFQARTYPFHRAISAYVVGGDGIIGLPMSVLCGLLMGFLFFGAALIITGAGDGFVTLALSLLGNRRGGMAKVAILASGLLGSLSGAVAANVIATGSFTIPAMKKQGFAPEYAGAVEACASTGAVLMPPVMGTVAFIVAYFLNIPYYQVCLAAAIPSILYYGSLFVQIDFYAAKNGFKGSPKSELPPLIDGIKEVSIYAIAIIVMIYLLFYLHREAQAPFYAMAILFGIATLRRKTRVGFKKFFKFLETVGQLVGGLIPIMAGVGSIIAALYLTGLADAFATGLTSLSGDRTWLLIILSAVASFVLGMGLTMNACYVLVAVMVAPSLILKGFDPLAVHLFIMYCSILSFITPPVAIGAYAAAAIARSQPMSTGFIAMRLGVLLFLLPFLFIYDPAFILHATPLGIIAAVGTAIPGIVLVGSALEGYMIGIGSLTLPYRIIFFVSGILIVIPSWVTVSAGIGLVLFIVAYMMAATIWGREKSFN